MLEVVVVVVVVVSADEASQGPRRRFELIRNASPVIRDGGPGVWGAASEESGSGTPQTDPQPGRGTTPLR